MSARASALCASHISARPFLAAQRLLQGRHYRSFGAGHITYVQSVVSTEHNRIARCRTSAAASSRGVRVCVYAYVGMARGLACHVVRRACLRNCSAR